MYQHFHSKIIDFNKSLKYAIDEFWRLMYICITAYIITFKSIF